MPTSFPDLPPELHDHICSMLEGPELSSIRLTCQCLSNSAEVYLSRIATLYLWGGRLDQLEAWSLHPRLSHYVTEVQIEASFFAEQNREEWEQKPDSYGRENMSTPLSNVTKRRLSTRQMNRCYENYCRYLRN